MILGHSSFRRSPGAQSSIVPLLAGSFLTSGLLGVCCYLIAGNSLDLFIGGLFLCSLLAPPLAAIAGRPTGAFYFSVAISLGAGCCWLLPVFQRVIVFGQWAGCMLILLSWLLLLSFAVLFLIRLGCGGVAGSATVTVVSLAWLSAPVWLSAALSGMQLRWSVAFHPLFAMNGLLHDLGIWTEQAVAYRLTSVGQDVEYQLPRSAWPIVAFQFGLAGLLYMTCMAPRSTIQINNDASSISSK